jgi:DNA-binding transcriptional ArsR family regulator
MPVAASLDSTFAALADPTRRAILARLMRGPARVTDLATPFDMSLNGVSKHLKALESAGLLRRERRGREHFLALRAEPIRRVRDWSGRFERFWGERLDALAAQLEHEEE